MCIFIFWIIWIYILIFIPIKLFVLPMILIYLIWIMLTINLFFIFHQNISSFNFNIEEFLLHTDNLNIDPHVNILSETWFCDIDFHDVYIYILYVYICMRDTVRTGVTGRRRGVNLCKKLFKFKINSWSFKLDQSNWSVCS